MGRKSQQLTESFLGQQLALPVAAHLARTQLVPDPLSVYDGQHLSYALDVVANALAKVALLYVQDAKNGSARELTAAELEGAVARRGATILVLKDGRTLSSVSMKRADLRQAIAILKAVGVPELRAPQPPKEAPAPEAAKRSLAEDVRELESLLRSPLIEQHVEKANRLAVAIARHARAGRVANLAMQLLSAVHETRGAQDPDLRPVKTALARLSSAVDELEQRDTPAAQEGLGACPAADRPYSP